MPTPKKIKNTVLSILVEGKRRLSVDGNVQIERLELLIGQYPLVDDLRPGVELEVLSLVADVARRQQLGQRCQPLQSVLFGQELRLILRFLQVAGVGPEVVDVRGRVAVVFGEFQGAHVYCW
jgi:hypothetical protein